MVEQNFLISGGMGFVGKNLTEALLKDFSKCSIWIVDNNSTESSGQKVYDSRVNYFDFDLAENAIFEEIMDKLPSIDAIFHLAAKARIQPSFENPYEYFHNNVMSTARICDWAKKWKCPVIYAMTSSKKPEEGVEGSYFSPYTCSKYLGEQLLRCYQKCFGINVGICVFYNVYGPGEPEKGPYATVVGKFLRQNSEGKELTVVGNGKQTRFFTHVSDICKGLISVYFFLKNHPGTISESFLFANRERIEILSLAKQISNKYVFIGKRINEHKHASLPDEEITKTEETLNWKANIRIQDYISFSHV